MITTKRGLLLAALLTLAVAMIAMFPARVAYRWAAPVGVAASGIQGTTWRGHADAVSVNGIYIGDVSWRLRPLRLFTGQASYHVQGVPASGFVEAKIGIRIGGKLIITELAASLPLNLFSRSLNISGLKGDASLQFERIEVIEGLPVAADGTVRVNGLVAPRLSRESIGGYEAEFFTQNNGIAATVEDTDGIVDLAGSLQVREDRSYQFLGKIAAKPGAPAGLKRQLEYLGSADDRGQRELRLEGML